MDKKVILGMAIHAFVLSFLLWQGTIIVNAEQQLITGIMFLILYFVWILIERIPK